MEELLIVLNAFGNDLLHSVCLDVLMLFEHVHKRFQVKSTSIVHIVLKHAQSQVHGVI